MPVSVPNGAVTEGSDLLGPLNDLLDGLNLCPSKEDLAKAGKSSAAITGTPDSVAVIEAGATSVAKWWSVGAGAAIVGSWGAVWAWWGDQPADVQCCVIIAAAVVTAAMALAIGFLLGSDVRGRALAATATIEARRSIATRWVRSSVAAFGAHGAVVSALIALPSALEVRLTTRAGDDEFGWRAVAIERDVDGTLRYVVVKGGVEERATANQLDFGSW